MKQAFPRYVYPALVRRESKFVMALRAMCADVCEACGAECEKHEMAHCQECAGACRRMAAAKAKAAKPSTSTG